MRPDSRFTRYEAKKNHIDVYINNPDIKLHIGSKVFTRYELYRVCQNRINAWLILKNPEKLNEAKVLFGNTAIKFTTERKRHLGAALGNDTFRSEYANIKVKKWCDEIEKLCIYAKSQPQAAYAAFIHGEQHKFCYLMRTIQGMSQFMQPLDNLINDKFIPTLLGSSITQTERDLFSLPQSRK